MTIPKFLENGRQLSKQVENTVGKGEIARYEQFLLFPRCFQKACFPEASKGVIVWEWVKKVVVWKSFEFGQVQRLTFGKDLNCLSTVFVPESVEHLVCLFT